MNKTFLGHFVIADETVDINLFYCIILSSKLQYIDCTCHSAWLNKALNFIKNASYNLSVLNGVYKKLLISLNSLVKTSSQTMVDMYTGNVVILFHQIELHGISTYGSFKGPFTFDDIMAQPGDFAPRWTETDISRVQNSRGFYHYIPHNAVALDMMFLTLLKSVFLSITSKMTWIHRSIWLPY